MNLYTISRNLGFITGPIILFIGIYSYMKGIMPTFAIVISIMGLIRIGLTIYTYRMRNKENQE